MDAGAAAGAAAAAAAAACGAGTWAVVITRLPASATTQLSHCALAAVRRPHDDTVQVAGMRDEIGHDEVRVRHENGGRSRDEGLRAGHKQERQCCRV